MITKLWENHEPTSSFPAQTITITNLSDYEIIIFDFIEGINVVSHLSAISFFNVPVTLSGQTAGNHFVSRYATFGNNSISFSGGYIDATANDNRAIPYAIYGIKVL